MINKKVVCSSSPNNSFAVCYIPQIFHPEQQHNSHAESLGVYGTYEEACAMASAKMNSGCYVGVCVVQINRVFTLEDYK